MSANATENTSASKASVDAVVVGAGWGGMFLVYKLRKAGFTVQLFEAGSDVGGTWYWNRYPGCRVDTPSVDYSFSFDEKLEQEWNWPEQYSTQPELEKYARHVAERFDLYPHMRFNTRVTSAVYDAETNRWTVGTDRGDRISARYCILATGGYTQPITPDIPGISDFKGELYYTARFPKEKISYAGKRVGVIGTGSSGMQTATQVAGEGVAQLYVFQRTPNFAVPAHNKPMDPEYLRSIKATYRQRRERARSSGSGTVYPGKAKPIADMNEAEFRAHMDEAWGFGGPAVLAALGDIMSSEKANARFADYIRDSIRRRVKDPAVAEQLMPHGHFVGERRTLIEDRYFEIYNQPNVTLVNVRNHPIESFTPKGLRSGAVDYALDMIILATGFDSGTGAILNIDIQGKEGVDIRKKWSTEIYTYLGMMVDGFPNLFSIDGPGSPSIRANMLAACELQGDWIVELLQYARAHDVVRIEVSAEAEQAWTHHVENLARATLLMRHPTQYCGGNVPGKLHRYLAYVGGFGRYREVCERVRDRGYEGFLMTTPHGMLPSTRAWSGPSATEAVKMRGENTVI